MPGLIEAHMHLMTGGSLQRPTGDLIADYNTAFFRACENAREYLRYGYTTVRDLSSAHYSAIYVRNAINQGLIVGPRVITSGPIIMSSQKVFGLDAGHVIADGRDECRKVARQVLARGADVLKLYNSSNAITPNIYNERSLRPVYSVEEIATFVEVAEANNTYVSMHCDSASAVNDALRAGVYTVEHAEEIDDWTMEFLAKETAFLVPTLSPLMLLRSQFAEGSPRGVLHEKMYADSIVSFQRAYAAGFKLGFGSDIGVSNFQKHPGYEFKARKEMMGCRDVDILLMATKYNAEILKIDHLVGMVEEGLEADLILVDGRPDEDISAMYKKPDMVFAKGALIHD